MHNCKYGLSKRTHIIRIPTCSSLSIRIRSLVFLLSVLMMNCVRSMPVLSVYCASSGVSVSPLPLSDTGQQTERNQSFSSVHSRSNCLRFAGVKRHSFLQVIIFLQNYVQCGGSRMFIPDQNFFPPGSEFYPSRIRIFPSWIRIKEFKYINPKNCF